MTRPRPTTARQRSTRPQTWATLRRRRLAAAAAALTRAGRALELIPDDDAGRMADWAFRLAARCRAEREAAA